MDIKDWQKLFSEAIYKKYPKSDPLTRVRFMEEELYDVKTALKVELGELKAIDHRYKSSGERVAGLLANVFEFCEQRNIDIEKELSVALDFFLDLKRKGSSENPGGSKRGATISDMKKLPLYVYVIGVAIVWAIILTFSWFGIIWTPFHDVVSVCAGFALGMLAMYIAVHLYRWK